MGTKVSREHIAAQTRNAIDAIATKDITKFESAIRQIPARSINEAVDKKGRTLMHMAAIANDPAFYACAEKYGCSYNKQDANGMTPGQVRNKVVHACQKWENERFSNSEVAYNCAQEIAHYMENGDFYEAAAVSLIMPKGMIDTPTDEKGNTVMHKAVEVGADPSLLRILVAVGGSVGARNIDGNTPLHVVAGLKNANAEENAEVLCDAASKSELNAVNFSGDTALHVAAKQSCVGTAEAILCSRTDFCAVDRSGENAIGTVCKLWSNKDIEGFLSKARAAATPGKSGTAGYTKAIFSPDKNGVTPLFHIASRGLQCSLRIFRESMKDADKDLGHASIVREAVTGEGGETHSILHVACSSCDKTMVDLAKDVVGEAYHRYGEGAFEELDFDDKAPVHIAATLSTPEVFEEVLRSSSTEVINAGVGGDQSNLYNILVDSDLRSKDIEKKLDAVFRSGKDNAAINAPSPATGDTPLVSAYKKGKKGVCNKILWSNSVDVDAPCSDGLTIVHHAAAKGDIKFLKDLLKRRNRGFGAGKNKYDNEGVTPVTHIVREYKGEIRNCEKVLDLLVPSEPSVDALAVESARHGAKDLIKSFARRGVNIEGALISPEGVETGLVKEALRGGNVDIAMYLVDKHAKVNTGVEPTLTVGFENQCFSGRQGNALLQKLLRAGAEVNVKPGSSTTSPLEAAITNPDARSGKVSMKVVKLLVSKGADVNHVSALTGDTLLHKAAAACDRKLIKYLLSKGASPVRGNNIGDTLTHVAARSGDVALLEFCVKQNPGSMLHANKLNAETVLHIACQSSKVSEKDLMRVLKTTRGILGDSDFQRLVNAQRNHDGETILHFVSTMGFGKACKFLVDHGADRTLVNDKGLTAGDVANISLSKRTFLDRVLFRPSVLKTLYDGVDPISERSDTVYERERDVEVTNLGTVYIGDPAKTESLSASSTQINSYDSTINDNLDESPYASIDERSPMVNIGNESYTSRDTAHPEYENLNYIRGATHIEHSDPVENLSDRAGTDVGGSVSPEAADASGHIVRTQDTVYAQVSKKGKSALEEGNDNQVPRRRVLRTEAHVNIGVPTSSTPDRGSTSKGDGNSRSSLRSEVEKADFVLPGVAEAARDLVGTSLGDSTLHGSDRDNLDRGTFETKTANTVEDQGNRGAIAGDTIGSSVYDKRGIVHNSRMNRAAPSNNTHEGVGTPEVSEQVPIESLELSSGGVHGKTGREGEEILLNKLNAVDLRAHGEVASTEGHVASAAVAQSSDRNPAPPLPPQKDNVSKMHGEDAGVQDSSATDTKARNNFMRNLKDYLVSQKEKLRNVEKTKRINNLFSDSIVKSLHDAISGAGEILAGKIREFEEESNAERSSWDNELEEDYSCSSSLSSSRSSLNSENGEGCDTGRSAVKKDLEASSQDSGIDSLDEEEQIPATGSNVAKLMDQRTRSSNMGVCRQ